MAAQQLGIFGGTFDPVHLGHLAVAEEVRDAAQLDRVLFVPNQAQPLKHSGPWATGALRLAMLEAAVQGNSNFGVDSVELERDGASFTIETLEELRRRWPHTQLRFVLGVDAANGMAAWRQPERILAEFRPIVMTRAGWPELDWKVLESIYSEARSEVTLITVPAIGIASSAIRERVAAGRSIRYLVPDAVRMLIEDARLYRN